MMYSSIKDFKRSIAVSRTSRNEEETQCREEKRVQSSLYLCAVCAETRRFPGTPGRPASCFPDQRPSPSPPAPLDHVWPEVRGCGAVGPAGRCWARRRWHSSSGSCSTQTDGAPLGWNGSLLQPDASEPVRKKTSELGIERRQGKKYGRKMPKKNPNQPSLAIYFHTLVRSVCD